MDFIFDPSLVLYLPLRELDGASFMSRDADGHLCTVTGALWRPDGRAFDGDDRIVCGQTASLDLTGAFTIEFWIKAAHQVATQVAKRSTSNDWPYVVHSQGSGILSLYSDNGSVAFVSPTLAVGDNTWSHYVVTRDNTDISFYVDGVADFGNPQTLAQGSSDPDAHDSIGAQTTNGGSTWINGVTGDIGEVRLYNRALTPLEIQRNYLATKWRYR